MKHTVRRVICLVNNSDKYILECTLPLRYAVVWFKRKPDWKCKCKKSNYNSRVECRQCKAPKPPTKKNNDTELLKCILTQ